MESIDVDRSRKVASGRIARKPAPMLVLRTLTFKTDGELSRGSLWCMTNQQLRRLDHDRVRIVCARKIFWGHSTHDSFLPA